MVGGPPLRLPAVIAAARVPCSPPPLPASAGHEAEPGRQDCPAERRHRRGVVAAQHARAGPVQGRGCSQLGAAFTLQGQARANTPASGGPGRRQAAPAPLGSSTRPHSAAHGPVLAPKHWPLHRTACTVPWGISLEILPFPFHSLQPSPLHLLQPACVAKAHAARCAALFSNAAAQRSVAPGAREGG